jgi:hypothetical protein
LDLWTCTNKLQKQMIFLDERRAGCDGAAVGYTRAVGTCTLKNLLQENFIPTRIVVYRRGGLGRGFPTWFSRSSLGDLPLHTIVAGQKKIELLDDCTAV